MAAIVVAVFEIEDADLQDGWAGKLEELEGSVVARLDEIIGDDGGAYVPSNVKVNVIFKPGI